MNKNYILIVIAFIIIAIAGPKLGEIITEKRILTAHKRMVQKLIYAQDIERARLKKINEAHREYIKLLEDGK